MTALKCVQEEECQSRGTFNVDSTQQWYRKNEISRNGEGNFHLTSEVGTISKKHKRPDDLKGQISVADEYLFPD